MRSMAEVRGGALIARVSPAGKPFPCYLPAPVTATAPGTLTFGVNDKTFPTTSVHSG